MKRIGILGLGGIGGYIGAKLANHYQEDSSVDVVFIARGESKEKINSEGIELIDPQGESIKGIPTITSDQSNEIGTLDVLFICVKSFSLRDVLKTYSACIQDETCIIFLQNSVDVSVQMESELSNSPILMDGSIYIISNQISSGKIHHKGGPAKILFGSTDTVVNDNCKWIETILKDANLDASISNEIQKVTWTKFLFVSPLAMLTAAYNKTIGEVVQDVVLSKSLKTLMNEVYVLASKKGIDLDHDAVDKAFKLATTFPVNAKTSFQIDVEQKRRTEKEALGEFVVQESGKLDLVANGYDATLKELEGVD